MGQGFFNLQQLPWPWVVREAPKGIFPKSHLVLDFFKICYRYNRTEKTWVRVLLMSAAFMVMLTLPVLFSVYMVSFVRDTTVVNKVEWGDAEAIAYPNITVCNAKYFNKELLRGETMHSNVLRILQLLICRLQHL